jgi:MoxR-like ATPase
VLAQASTHGWLPPSWRDRIEAVHTQRCAQVDALAARLTELHAGFAGLPRLDEDSSEFVPTPVIWQA